MQRARRLVAVMALLLVSVSLAGCDGNVGVGVSVGVPVGSHGYMSVGGTRWR
ncbi:MAG: putative small secreted protein [Woeseiaceae bacterium]|jgi:predicted small secreted protein